MIYRSTVVFFGAEIKNEDHWMEIDENITDQLMSNGLMGIHVLGFNLARSPLFILISSSLTEISDMVPNARQPIVKKAREFMHTDDLGKMIAVVKLAAIKFGFQIDIPDWYIGFSSID